MTRQSTASTGKRISNWRRSIVHMSLRSTRSLFAPLLNRLQLRMQSAVEQSSLVTRLQAVEAEALSIKTKTLEIQSEVQRGHAETQDILTKLLEVEAILGRSQMQLVGMETLVKELGISFLNADQQRSKQIEIQTAVITAELDMSQIAKQLQCHTAELSARLDVLQVSCDVLRLNQIELDKLDRQGVG